MAMQTISLGNFVDPEQEQITRRRMMADALRKQGSEGLETQVAQGGVAVPTSWTQLAAKALQSYGGMRMEDEAVRDARALDEKRRGEFSTDLGAVVKALKGSPAIPSYETGANEMGDETVMQKPAPAQGPDPMAALDIAARSRAPGMQQVASSLVGSVLPKTPKMERVSIPDGKGGERVGFVDMNNPNPMSTFQEGGKAPAKGIAVNGRIVSPYAVGEEVPPQANPASDLLVPDGQGGFKPNTQLVGLKKEIAQAGKPNQQTTVMYAGPKAFATELGKLDAEQLNKWRTGAEAANGTLGVVENLRNAEAKGAYSGATADARLAGARFVEAVTGVAPKGMVGSELYNAESKKLILEHIKTLGANPSNADREFIEKTVPQLGTSAQARAAMTQFMERKAMQQIDLYRRADAFARQNNGLGGFNQFPGVRNLEGSRATVSNW